jgi:hypothetical protein
MLIAFISEFDKLSCFVFYGRCPWVLFRVLAVVVAVLFGFAV